ncbi:MAG: radical SAM protein [Crenarchaeota archaeon]|nr:radical SAM protein [Thermoproteota archaeon]
MKNNVVECLVCERRCRIPPGGKGFCRNRMNIDGRFYYLYYGCLSALEPRPIEVKPLYHYYPGSTALTFSGYGCNFPCPWCQNWALSKADPAVMGCDYVPPEDLVLKALNTGCRGVCASFKEPTIHLEYVLDVSRKAGEHGLYSCIVTNGYMTLDSLRDMLEAGITGYSIDIKGCPKTYRRFLAADPEIVFRNAKYILDRGGHVEMVYLVVTRANDWEECIEYVLSRHHDLLGEDTPLHINRYYPAYKYNEPPTPLEKLLEIREEALREYSIKYVYIGNTIHYELQDTICPRCGKRVIIRRPGYVLNRLTSDHRCPRCGEKILIYEA